MVPEWVVGESPKEHLGLFGLGRWGKKGKSRLEALGAFPPPFRVYRFICVRMGVGSGLVPDAPTRRD